MADGNLSKLLIAFLLGAAVVTGMGTWLGDVAITYGKTDIVDVAPLIAMGASARTSINTTVGVAANDTASTTPSPDQPLLNPWSGAWIAISNLINAPSALIAMIGSLLSTAGIGLDWFSITLITIVALIGLFALIKVFTGREP